MATAYLKLKNDDGSFREYRKEKIKARWVKEAFKHSQEIERMERKGDIVGVIDTRLKFTCDFFGDKDLTPEAILDGLENDELIDTLDGLFDTIVGRKKKDNNEQGNG